MDSKCVWRRSFEGLALLVRGALREDERSSQIFVFTNRRRDWLRLLYWDGTDLQGFPSCVPKRMTVIGLWINTEQLPVLDSW